MNWTDLDELYCRAISKEMTIKEASDFISMTWHLISFHTDHRELYDPAAYGSEHQRLIELSIAVFHRAHDKE